ncbi:MAG: ChaN family lipoprotein [Geobacteraceae bacterium]|nr:ChaN family lipoprotein [Geobacteraceae bacterium]
MDALPVAYVIFVAEIHDDKKHHELQLDVIRSLRSKKIPLAIGLEMFQMDNQNFLDDWVAGRITEQDFTSIFARNWTYDWSLYRDIFIFARDNHIPMIALNIPKDIISKVVRQGFASLTPEELKSLPPGITSELNKPQTDLLRNTYQAIFKRAANEKKLANFFEAQAVRNSGMASIIAGELKSHPGRKVVTLAGTWHAVRHGVPEFLPNIGSKVIVPEIPEFGVRNATLELADYLIEK